VPLRLAWTTAILVDVQATRILVVEDDAPLRSTLSRGLSARGFSVTSAADGASAMRFTSEGTGFDVIILDIGLPDSDGRDVCQAMRANGIRTPVLFLTARGHVGDLLSGFAAGGDDYLAKPFHAGELFARVAALSKRSAVTAPTAHPDGEADPAQSHLDPRTHALVSANGTHALTPTEYRILAALMGSPGEVLRRQSIISAAWPEGAIVSSNTLDQYVSRLRRKLSDAGVAATIHTAHGIGYRYT
jgi:DNA-binding response OmpR family regulator